jgi:hypothetical protein
MQFQVYRRETGCADRLKERALGEVGAGACGNLLVGVRELRGFPALQQRQKGIPILGPALVDNPLQDAGSKRVILKEGFGNRDAPARPV